MLGVISVRVHEISLPGMYFLSAPLFTWPARHVPCDVAMLANVQSDCLCLGAPPVSSDLALGPGWQPEDELHCPHGIHCERTPRDLIDISHVISFTEFLFIPD